MAQPMMRWVNVSLSSRLFIVFSVSSVFKQSRRLRSCMTSSRAVGRCVRHRGHGDTEDTEEFRDFASTTLPTTDGRICCLAITAGAPRSSRGLFVYTLSKEDGLRRGVALQRDGEHAALAGLAFDAGAPADERGEPFRQVQP